MIRSKQRNPTYHFEIIRKSYVKEAELPRISLCNVSVIYYLLYYARFTRQVPTSEGTEKHTIFNKNL